MPTAVTAPELNFDRCYRILTARDSRFDGQFFVTVATTGIYCRPSCPAQTPLARNVAFVLTAAAAQRGGFRACRRCAPDAVPGSPRWNVSADLASRAMRLIADGVVEREGVDGLASRLGYSTRQLGRVLTAELGAGPLALARAHRATNARVLIQCTTMPMTYIAFAAGFSSIRQFNDTIREVFALPPSALRELRASRAHNVAAPVGGTITLRLPYRQPIDSTWLRWFLTAHAIPGVTDVDGDEFVRTLALPHGPALLGIDVGPADRGHIMLRLRHLDMRDLGVAVSRVRRLLDLDADITAADATLGADARLSPLVTASPGMRVPGSLDAAETLLTTMIGQQISVAAARTHVGDLVDALGETAPWDRAAGPHRLFPTSATVAEHGAEVLRGPRRRIEAIVGAAAQLAENSVELHPGVAASDMRGQLLALRGVGTWTANYVSMRVASDPDVLLATDLVLARSALELGIDLADSAKWAPWRSYASMHLWRRAMLPDVPTPTPQPSTTQPPTTQQEDTP